MVEPLLAILSGAEATLQRSVSILLALRNLFVPARSHRSAFEIHHHRLQALTAWKTVIWDQVNRRRRPYRVLI
ncbi:hypothetical protein EB232_35110 (plasmid) [Mesorhizobium sp. NZP2077]|nr:hypothetical protein EB232_35110 [Mesorhizobium sp. NZP2077]